jgi:glyoxylase-like metal-dependent hydrolase (beta-lactamase superfamily II)
MKEVAPGLFQLSGFPPNGINVYLAEDVLIDAATRMARGRIMRQVKDRPLAMLALTHAHPDHQGSAKAICDARGIPLACHADDVAAMESGELQPGPHQDTLINKVIAKLWQGPPRKVDRVLGDGDEVAGFRVLHAPGHSPGEVIYFRESDGVAICGDVINTLDVRTGLPSVREPPAMFTTDVEQNRRSIVKLAELNPSVVCPGHGAPLRKIGKLDALADRFR